MNCEWEIRRLDSGDVILREVSRIARPVGILLFGADGELKDYICHNIRFIVGHIGITHNIKESGAQERIKASLLARENVLIVMDGKKSRNSQCRDKIIQKLRKLGARKIVGICVRYAPGTLSTEDDIETDVQFQFHPPTIENLDYLILVTNIK